MKQESKNQAGATLVEILIAIAIGSMITLAVTTVLLLGLRINAKTSDAVMRQNSVRTVLSIFENIASEGTYSRTDSTADGWTIYVQKEGEAETEFASYDNEEGIIYLRNVSMLEGVSASSVVRDGKLLTFEVETEDGKVSSSVYCRTIEEEETKVSIKDLNKGRDEDRDAFIEVLLSQEGAMAGYIKKYPGRFDQDSERFEYFSEWYVGGYSGEDKWNKETAWCGCFISWGLYQVRDQVQPVPLKSEIPKDKWYANVETMRQFFLEENKEIEGAWLPQTPEGAIPQHGDLIFFDLEDDGEVRATHIGAVVGVDDGKNIVQTIEGNTEGSGDYQNVYGVWRKEWELNDPRILGYGVLIWGNNSPK